jgi:hypothetical protein
LAEVDLEGSAEVVPGVGARVEVFEGRFKVRGSRSQVSVLSCEL